MGSEQVNAKLDETTPNLFAPHPNLSDEVNGNIAQSEIEGGVSLDNLPDGEVLEVETQNRWYTIVNRGSGRALISGHPKFCGAWLARESWARKAAKAFTNGMSMKTVKGHILLRLNEPRGR